VLIKCIKNKIVDVDSKQLKAMHINYGDSDYTFGVSPGKTYLVYGIADIEGVRNYLLCFSDGQYENLDWFIEGLFSVEDKTPSRHWFEKDLGLMNESGKKSGKIWLHESLASIENVFSSIKEGGDRFRILFYECKLLFDAEFQYVDVDNYANRIDGDWLMCPNCENVWEQKLEDAYEVCKSCNSLLKRPN
jgi:hypothetical protein